MTPEKAIRVGVGLFKKSLDQTKLIYSMVPKEVVGSCTSLIPPPQLGNDLA